MGHFLRLFHKVEQRYLAKIESSDKKIFRSVKDFADNRTKITGLLIQNCKTVFFFFFALNMLLLVSFACSLLLKKIKNLFKNWNISFRSKGRQRKTPIKLDHVIEIVSRSFGKIFAKSST